MSKTKRLQIIDGESLMSLPLTPLNFVVDTLQMICNTNYDNTCANDNRDLSALKRIADAPGIRNWKTPAPISPGSLRTANGTAGFRRYRSPYQRL